MMPLYKKYADTKPIRVMALCNWGGLEILDIEYGIDDYVIACFNYGNGRLEIRRHKVMYTPAGRVYIRKHGVRYYYDQMLPV